MTALRLPLLSLSLLTLGGCFPVYVDKDGVVPPPYVRDLPAENSVIVSTPDQSSDEDFLDSIGTLPPQSLNVGECGLFLWARTADRKLVLFSKAQDQSALMQINEQTRRLAQTDQRGQAVFGLNTYQTFEADPLTVTVNFFAEAREGLTSGAIVPEGTMRLQTKDGWEIVLPVAGLIGCETEIQQE